jgi:hypothetical protein
MTLNDECSDQYLRVLASGVPLRGDGSCVNSSATVGRGNQTNPGDTL